MKVPVHTYYLLYLSILCGHTTYALEHNRPTTANTLLYPMNKTSDALRIMTYNIRTDVEKDRRQGHSWDVRKYDIKRIIDYYHPDIIGLQEVSISYMKDLKQLFPQYYIIAEQINPKDYDAVILINTKRCIIQQSSFFWLAENPSDSKSSIWDARFRRIVIYARITDRKTNKDYFVFCTHFDSSGIQAKLESSRLLVQQQQCIAGTAPAIIMGDFNLFPTAQAHTMYAQLLSSGLHDIRDLSSYHYGPDGTWIGWSSDPHSVIPGTVGKRIDQIFVRSIKVLKEGVLHIKIDAHGKIISPGNKTFMQRTYPSDHLPIIADIVLK